MGLVKKPTGFMTSSKCLIDELNKKCDGGSDHVPLIAGRAAGAAIYPELPCEEICRGVVRQKKHGRTATVTTGRLSHLGLKSFVRHICDLQGSSANKVEHLLSTGSQRETILMTGSTSGTTKMEVMIIVGSDLK